MPDIRLQDYVAKIKDLNRDGRHDEAIAHCQHILRYYPKYIEVYCLLGEACLEKGLYREAIEFFQRTLSADPENFIARVGLGIIYAEQGAVPEAIWQMERAFELAPGNAEVRRELQRLYTQRDGAEKSRLKLTRGALGRLYARNGLYERAISEFRAVLRQESDLPDVRVTLLEALWHEGRRLEAVEDCLDLLEALPNCLKANLILGEIWTRGGHEDAGEEKLELANALDPENLVAQEMMGRDSPLKPQEVHIPELTTTPEMLKGVGLTAVEMPTPAGWERGVEETEEAQPEETAEAWETAEEMPDWLLAIGAAQVGAFATAHETETPAAEPPPAEEVPEWLRELVGEEVAPLPAVETPAREAAPAEEAPDWLQETVSREQAPVAEKVVPPPEEVPTEKAIPAEELPDWLRELGVPRAEVATEKAIPAEELPDWLRELRVPRMEEITAPAAEEAPFVEAVPPAAAAPPSAPEVPDSLKALVAAGLLDEANLESAVTEMSAEEVEAQKAEEVPDWLKELMGKEVAPAVGVAAAAEEIPEWLREMKAPEAEEIAPSEAEEVLPSEAKEVLPPKAEEVLLPKAEEVLPAEAQPPTLEVPESLKALVAAGLLDEADLESAIAEMSAEELETQKAEEVPDWLKELMGEEVVPAVGVATAAEEVPDWLRELKVPEAEEIVPPEAKEVLPEEEVPGWLRELKVPEAEEIVPPEAKEVLPVEEAQPPAPEVPESLKALVAAGLLDAADLESAIAEMSAEELEAQKAEEVPDWLKELVGEEVAPVAEEITPPPVEEAPAEEVAPAEEIPAWLRELEVPEAKEVAPAVAEERVEEAAPAEEIPAWLRELEVPKAREVTPAAAEERVEEAPPAEEIPAWLRELEVPKAKEVTPAAAEERVEEAPPAEEIPTWLREWEVPEKLAEEIAPAEEIPDWLRELEVPETKEVAPPFVEEVISRPVAEELAEEVPVVEEKVALPVVELVAPPTEAEMVAPIEQVKVEEEAAPPSRLDELSAQVKDRPRDYKARLELARLYRDERDWNATLNHYERLITARKHLPTVIEDLNLMAEEPVDRARLYQLLGDAYVQDDQLNEALEMYRRARQALAKR